MTVNIFEAKTQLSKLIAAGREGGGRGDCPGGKAGGAADQT